MKKLALALAAAVCLSLSVAGQSQDASKELLMHIKDYMRFLPGNGLVLTLVHLNDKTVPQFFQPPMLYAMRARANSSTMLYVQGAAEKNVELDTTNFTITQNGQVVPSTPTNIKNFTKGKVKIARGDRVDGVLTFARKIDATQPFTVTHDEDSVEFRFTPDQLKAMTPAPTAQ